MSPRVLSLRDKHEDSIKLLFEIPIVFRNKYKGAKKIFIDHARLPYYLNLRQSVMIDLQRAGLLQSEAPVKVSRLRIDYLSLAQEYKKELDGGEYATRADHARSLGVSRAWISKVLNREKKNPDENTPGI